MDSAGSPRLLARFFVGEARGVTGEPAAVRDPSPVEEPTAADDGRVEGFMVFLGGLPMMGVLAIGNSTVEVGIVLAAVGVNASMDNPPAVEDEGADAMAAIDDLRAVDGEATAREEAATGDAAATCGKATTGSAAPADDVTTAGGTTTAAGAKAAAGTAAAADASADGNPAAAEGPVEEGGMQATSNPDGAEPPSRPSSILLTTSLTGSSDAATAAGM